MEHNNWNVHFNCMKLGIICFCFVCFMIAGCAFMEIGKGGAMSP